MLEPELKDIWKNSSRTSQITFETNQLIDELNAKVSDIQKKIRNRDLREISASLFGILIFGYMLYEIPFPITKLACGFSIMWFVFVIFKFKQSKQQNIPAKLSLSLTEQLDYQETTMQYQVNLLESAAYWYSAPAFVTNLIFIVGLGNPVDYSWSNTIAESFLPLTINLKIITIIGLTLFYAFTIWINKRAVTVGVKPLLKNVKAMQQQLDKE
jgi:Ca2+/Na+ antiporter